MRAYGYFFVGSIFVGLVSSNHVAIAAPEKYSATEDDGTPQQIHGATLTLARGGEERLDLRRRVQPSEKKITPKIQHRIETQEQVESQQTEDASTNDDDQLDNLDTPTPTEPKVQKENSKFSYDPIPTERKTEIERRMKLAYKIFKKKNRLYDFRLLSTAELESLLKD